MSTSLLIAVNEIAHTVDPKQPLVDRLKAAMKEARNHWLVVNEDEQFRAAVGAVLLESSDDEKERLTREMTNLRAMSALMSGVPVDLERLDTSDSIGLVALWHETKEAR